MLVALCLLWGVTWPAMKIALMEIPPLSMRTLTAAAGVLTLLAVCLATRTRLRVPPHAWGHVVAIACLNIGAFSLLTAYAQVAAATSRVTILIYTMPIWAVLLAWIVLREKPNGRQLLAVMLCALGLVVLIAPLAATGVPLGLLLAVTAGASWGAGTVYVKWARLDIDSLALAFWQLVIAFGLIAACLPLFDGRLDIDRAHAPALLATAFSGIVGSGIAYAMWFAIVRRLPAATASLGALGIPVVGVLVVADTIPAGFDVFICLQFPFGPGHSGSDMHQSMKSSNASGSLLAVALVVVAITSQRPAVWQLQVPLGALQCLD
jgi:drug/metabolite transporter (DMT)-like permease